MGLRRVAVDDPDLFSNIMQWLFGAVLALGGVIMKAIHGDIVNLKTKSAEQAKNLDEYKLQVSETYSKEAVTQLSLARIHERIDKMGESINGQLNEVSRDIKELLKEVK